MKIIVNNQEVETKSTHLLQLLEELSLPTTGIAVAADNRMVSKSDWKEFRLNELMNIVIIKAVCGG